MRKSNWWASVSLWVCLLLCSGFVWGQASGNTTSSEDLLSNLDSAWNELENLAREAESLKLKLQSCNSQIQTYESKLQALVNSHEQTEKEQTELKRLISEQRSENVRLTESLTNVLRDLEKQSQTIKESKDKWAIFQQNFAGLLKLADKQQQTLEFYSTGFWVSTGAAALAILGLVIDLVFRK